MKMEYKVIDVRSEKGLRHAERLHQSGDWKMQPGSNLFGNMTFARPKPERKRKKATS